MPDSRDGELSIRAATDADLEPMVEVCSVSLGWTDPSFDRALFEWKHLQNPFGRSLMLVAELDREIVGVRTMMRWRFRSEGRVLTAARPVDTATVPAARGRGVFRSTTMDAIDALRAEGVNFVFNTPNDQSRPGYLDMGWTDAGRAPVAIRAASPLRIPSLLRNRVTASKRSEATDVGAPVRELIDRFGPPAAADDRLRTDHDAVSLTWRYAESPLAYRGLVVDDHGGLVIRLRRRGQLRELLVADRLGAPDPAEARRAIVGAIADAEADHGIAEPALRLGITTRRAGPRLTLRSVASDAPPGSALSLTPGDLELF